MNSPFPGMDPYIEACGLWEDFHGHLIEQLAEALAAAVPDHYVVRTGERAYLVLAEQEGIREHSFKPDVEFLSSTPAAGRVEGEVAVVESSTEVEAATMRAMIPTEYRESFIDIYALHPQRRLVTSIEVLSPSNNPLPTLPVPLAPPDDDVPLGVQPLIVAIYARFRYDQDIDYTRSLDPPLNPAEVEWIEQQLRLRRPPA
jgi:hypothetical protein